MTMRRQIIGLATIWPLLYVGWFCLTILGEVTGMGAGLELTDALVVVHALTMVLALVLVIGYLIHAANNASLAADRRVIWVLAILGAGLVAMPAYWWLHVRPRGARGDRGYEAESV